MFQSISSIVRHLSWEPDFLAKNRVFTNFVKWLKTCSSNMQSIVAVNRIQGYRMYALQQVI